MKKTTKGALAAAAAGTLLLGGAGSLAFWTASQTATGGSFTTGTLTLSTPTCTGWTYATGNPNGNVGGAVTLVVPGDVIAKTCDFTVGATGDNLKATLGAPSNVSISTPAGTTSFKGEANTTFTLNSVAIANGATVTSADNGHTLAATFTVTFDHGTDGTGSPVVNWNDTQSKTSNLGDLTVSLTQN